MIIDKYLLTIIIVSDFLGLNFVNKQVSKVMCYCCWFHIMWIVSSVIFLMVKKITGNKRAYAKFMHNILKDEVMRANSH